MLPQTMNNALMSREDKLIHSDQQRAIAEVQAALVIAAGRPRDEVRARERIMNACLNVDLANKATYNFPRGNKPVTGPSIRLAETCARYWGNLNYGFRELSREDGVSQCESFAWDMEYNTKVVRQFQVRHIRDKSDGGAILTSERDIYEHVANMAQRRVRSCLTEIIPKDIFDEAVEKCKATAINAIKGNSKDLKETISNMLAKFAELGVKKASIEKKYGRKVESLEYPHIVELGSIYSSIKDGMSEAGDWFEVEPEKSDLNEALKNNKQESAPKTQKKTAPKPEPEPAHPSEADEPTVKCPNDEDGDTRRQVWYCNTKCNSRQGCPAFDE